MMRIRTLFLSILITLVLSGCGQSLWVHKDFESLRSAMDTVSIIFPQIRYLEKGGQRDEAKTGLSLYVSSNVADVLEDQIDEGRFVPKFARPIRDSLSINHWLRTHFADSATTFTGLCDSTQEVRDGRRMLLMNPETKALLGRIPTRYCIFVVGLAFGVTESAKNFDMQQRETFRLLYDRPYVYDYQWYGLQAQISIVDARTGEILWSNANAKTDSKYNPLDKEEVGILISKLLTTSWRD